MLLLRVSAPFQTWHRSPAPRPLEDTHLFLTWFSPLALQPIENQQKASMRAWLPPYSSSIRSSLAVAPRWPMPPTLPVPTCRLMPTLGEVSAVVWRAAVHQEAATVGNDGNFGPVLPFPCPPTPCHRSLQSLRAVHPIPRPRGRLAASAGCEDCDTDLSFG